MLEKDFYSSLSDLMTAFLKLTNSLTNTISSDKDLYKSKCIDIYKKVCLLKTNKESEMKFQKKSIVFIKKIIEDKFNIKLENKNININKNLVNQFKKDFHQIKGEKEIKHEIIDPNGNKDKINISNNNITEQKNNNRNFNITLHSKKNKEKSEAVLKIIKINSDIDKLLSDNIHIILILKIKKIFNQIEKENINEAEEILKEIKFSLNNLFLKLKEINEKIYNLDIDEEYLSKYITLLFSVFPFFSKNQKDAISKWSFSKISNNYLIFKRILINLNEDNKIIENFLYEFFFSYEEMGEKEKKLNVLIKNVFKTSQNNKSLLYYSYQLMILFSIIFERFKSFYKSMIILSFKLYFILSNEKLFSFNSDQFSILYRDLLFIKNFYSKIYENEIKNPFLITIKKNQIFYGDFNLVSNIENVNTSFLFDKEVYKNYETIMNLKNGIIPHFYNINEKNINELIDATSYYFKNNKEKFLDNIISLTYIKADFIENNFIRYKRNLIKLETEIYNLAKSNLNKNKKDKIIDKYSQKKDYEKIFNNFVNDLNKEMTKTYKEKYNKKYKLYPMGSLTEYLSVNNSDLDLYLYIKKNSQRHEILEAIYKCVNVFCQKVEKIIISQRICVINLIYDKTEIDLSILGFSPYIHSLLFREYSLIDARFPLVGIAVKYVKDILCLDKEYYLNSYSWISLLVVFLQDIINPPILPKLLSDKKENEIIKFDIEYGHYKGARTDMGDSIRIKNFFKSLKKEKIAIPDCLFNKNKILNIYKRDIADIGKKNNLSCAEILLKFLEFITFYLKYDTIYAESSINGEGFFNMEDIKNIYLNDKKNCDEDINKYNYEFYRYFTQKYLKFKLYKIRKTRDGFILIRDPVDNHYNPGQKFNREENVDKFINKLRSCYSILIKYGSFDVLKKKYEKGIKDK